jgi:hypothetical protein
LTDSDDQKARAEDAAEQRLEEVTQASEQLKEGRDSRVNLYLK